MSCLFNTSDPWGDLIQNWINAPNNDHSLVALVIERTRARDLFGMKFVENPVTTMGLKINGEEV